MAKTNAELQAEIKSLSNDNVKIIQDNSKLIKDNLELQTDNTKLKEELANVNEVNEAQAKTIEEGFNNAALIEPVGCLDEIEELKEANEALQKQLDDLNADGGTTMGYVEPIVGMVAESSITRNDVIKAMLPQIRVKFPRSDTQDLMRAVDEVLETINA